MESNHRPEGRPGFRDRSSAAARYPPIIGTSFRNVVSNSVQHQVTKARSKIEMKFSALLRVLVTWW